ncbi:MAG: peptide ABC transporter substrate-binding protein [Anaerolineaceae bacterium]|nr:peptide ABC transporter substrate-binding protein [Anaerolineaceae bacterium]
MRSKFFVLGGLLIVFSMILGACQPAAVPTPESIIQTVIVEGTPQIQIVTATPVPVVPVEEMKVLTLNMGPGDIPTLDPSLGTDTSSIQIAVETFVGLTRQDEVTNEVEPGMATKWESVVNDDGTETITFTLRDDVPWVRWNGKEVEQVLDCEGNVRMVTANEFYYGIIRTLMPDTGSEYAYVLGMVMVGADDFNNGITDDPTTVGVEVIDEYTIALTFIEQAVYNPAIAGMWIAYAEPSWLIDGDDCTEARTDKWTETGFFQGYGPYTLKEWVHDYYLTLIKNPFWPGADNIPVPKIEEVTWTMLDASPAMAEYEAGNVDAVGVPLADMDRVKADPVLSAEYMVAPDFCTYYYGFNTTALFVDDVRVRRALSFAIDRQSLIDNVLKGGQEPAGWFSRPGLAGAPTRETHPELGVAFDADKAKAFLQEYLDEKGITTAEVDITLMFNTSEGHRRIAEAIQQMWKDVLGLDIKLVNQEWRVYLSTIKGAGTPQIYRLGWCLDYADANNFIREVFDQNGSSNPYTAGEPSGGVFWKNEEFSTIVRAAATEKDPVKRVEMYAQAEEIMVLEDAVMAPIYWYTRNTLTKPYVTRTYSTGGHEHIEKWDVDMAAKP